MTTTDRDIRDQVAETLGADREDYDVRGIADELIATYDLTGDVPRDTIAGIEATTYWDIVAKHQSADA